MFIKLFRKLLPRDWRGYSQTLFQRNNLVFSMIGISMMQLEFPKRSSTQLVQKNSSYGDQAWSFQSIWSSEFDVYSSYSYPNLMLFSLINLVMDCVSFVSFYLLIQPQISSPPLEALNRGTYCPLCFVSLSLKVWVGLSLIIKALDV